MKLWQKRLQKIEGQSSHVSPLKAFISPRFYQSDTLSSTYSRITPPVSSALLHILTCLNHSLHGNTPSPHLPSLLRNLTLQNPTPSKLLSPPYPMMSTMHLLGAAMAAYSRALHLPIFRPASRERESAALCAQQMPPSIYHRTPKLQSS